MPIFFLFRVVSTVLIDKNNFLKNFTLSTKNLKEALLAFRANKSVTDVTREVFHAATLLSSIWPSIRNPTPLLALVLVSGDSHSAAFRTLASFRMLACL